MNEQLPSFELCKEMTERVIFSHYHAHYLYAKDGTLFMVTGRSPEFDRISIVEENGEIVLIDTATLLNMYVAPTIGDMRECARLTSTHFEVVEGFEGGFYWNAYHSQEGIDEEGEEKTDANAHARVVLALN